MVATKHVPVLVREVQSLLVVRPDGNYLDATFGGGGHTRAILENIGESARLLAIDRDPDAVERGKQLTAEDSRVEAVHASFDQIADVSRRNGFEQFDGILFDVGLSSDQLEDGHRGFSFQKNGPLDMRMDPTEGKPASEWLNTASAQAIATVLRKFGDERNARAIANAIVRARPLSETQELVEVIGRAGKTPETNKHVATRTFQAIRIHVNDELSQLRQGLRNAFELIGHGGRIAVISFHSLEHRTVRRQFSQWVDSSIPARMPIRGSSKGPMKFVERGLTPKRQETESNPRARSAMLQVIERVQ
ncbi:MAG: 16S rRNA (cytosine(1402)-N(4))-methyltransferase RsmH [Gammaproteobacteria bacterium]|nr:16S rRNA (cytosine(1402)-N(4))-methyltransferase RsmH [Gammaproteobacteria bacterium]